ncbi:MAG: proprotein convertase P-domain-containing protein, partial [Bacteroidetes bacterium]|nr:proprotein convertase P-domain-containing protein [Bacteroidota bacterium]
MQARNSGGTSTDANGSVTTLSCGGVYTTNTFIGTLFAGTTVNWNLGGNWSLGHPPISCEDVVINANNIQPSSTTINYLYLNANATMHNLTITGANNPLTAGGSSGQRQALFIFTNGYKMDITGDLTISNDSTGGLAPATDNVLLTSGKGNGPIATGPITVYGTTTIGATGNRIASLGGGSSSGPGSITLKGDVVLGPQAFLNYGNLINYYFEKGGNQTLNITSTQGDDNTYGLGNLSIGSTTPTNLTITGTGTSRGSRVVGDLTIGANSSLSLPSGQNLNRSAPGGTFTMGSGATLNLSGSSSGATGSNAPDSFSVFSFHNTSTIVYNGTSMQSINAAYPYQNLTVNNAANVGLNGNTTVNNALTLTNGLVTTGSNQLTLGLAGSISGASSSRYINGTLAKTKAADVSGFLNFEIGDATQYAPVFIGFNGTTNSGGTFSAKTVSGMPSALGYQHSGISTTDYLNRKYTLNNTGITEHTSIYTKFSYANGDMISGGTASNNNYNIADSVYGSGWAIRSAQNASDPYSAATVSLTSGQTADYLIGNPDPAPAPTVDPLSSTTVCEGSSFLITGTNFYAISDVKIGSTSVSYTVNSPTQITITIPVGFGNGAVTVTNATNFATTSNSLTTLDQPQTTVTPSSQTICSGSALTTIVAGNSNSVPSTTYTWTRTGSNISGGTNTASGTGNVSGTLESSSTIAETITYSVVGSANGCTGTTAIATVTLKAAPGVANVSPSSSSICQNTILQLDGSYTAATGSSTKNSTGTSAIPDGSIAGVFNQVSVSNIPTGAVITRIDVNFDITHTYNGDLVINLTAPNGKTLNLVAGAGDAGANFVNTTVSSTGIDAFPATTTNNITGVYAPDAVGGVGPVTALSNASTFSELYSVGNGVWKLGIRDYGTPDAGTLTNWSIKIYYTLTSTFSWAPTAGLYINSGATTPYTGGTQQTVYVKNTPGSYSYKTLIASNGCTDSSSAANVEIEAVPVVTRNIASQTVCSGVNISDIVFSSSDLSASITWSRDETTNVTGIADNGTTGTISGALVNATAAPITVTFTGTATGNG